MFEQELNAYWKTVVDTIQDGVMIVDPGGTIVSVNKAFETITGYYIDEIIGKPCSTLNCNSCEIAREKNGCHWCALFRKGLLKKQRCVLMRKDGTYLHIFKNASVLHDAHGEVIGAVETMTDITELIERDTKIEAFQRELRAEDTFHGIIGASAPMQRIFDLVSNASGSDAPVIIFGESGTGKELVARAVHANSRRSKEVFFAVDCGTLSNNLLENELFGHSKGAFTDARDDKPGIFKQADGGTIFLDEISNISLEVQGKLLRFLESREFLPLGAVTPVPVNIRLIFATNRNLHKMVAAGLFREDFYYRIDVYPILLPPLKERKMDILPIAYHFLNQFNRKMDKPITGFEPAAITRLTEYDWPGNVRQLRNAIERAVILCETDQIAVKDLPLSGYMDDIGPLLENIPATNEELKQVKKQIRQKAVRGVEKNFILNALEKNNWNVTRSAKSVGLQRSNFHHMMKKYGISQQPRKPSPE